MDRKIDTESLVVNQQQIAETIYGFLQQKDSKESRKGANVILLMGGANLDDVTKKVFEIWQEDKTRVIVTSPEKGYFSGEYDELEADRYYHELVKLGVPKDKIIHKPISKNTIEEFENFPRLLEKAGVTPNKVVIIDRPVHQKRAFLNALKLQPTIKFVNAPADENFDLSLPENQLRCVSEIERLISYRDLVRPTIPMEILRDTAKLRGILKQQGVHERERDHPRYLYKGNPRVMDPTEKPWRTED